jgi:hypothetical protein
MSEHFQPGQHPDADMLSAFAEDALPAHEREETLLHLAECADCRSIVFLAQDAVVEDAPAPEPVPQLVPARKRWFFGWRLASTAAGVLACVVLVAIYAPHFFSRGNQVASNSSAPVSPSQTGPQSEVHPDSNGVVSSIASNNAAQSSASQGVDRRTVQALPARGRQTADLKQKNQPPEQVTGSNAVAGIVVPRRMDANNATGAAGGIGMGQGEHVIGSLDEKTSAAPPMQDASRNAFASAASTVAAQQATTSGMIQSAPAPVLHANYGPAQDTNQANDLAMVNAQSITSNVSMKKTPTPQQQFNLPSHLETVSAISDARLVLAIDSAGKLFASRDAGRHWKSIAPRWTGHAVRVNIASPIELDKMAPPAVHVPPSAKAAPADEDSALKVPMPQRISGNAGLAGVVTDPSGAVVPYATVTVTSQQTAQSIVVRTDGGGKYSVQNLVPGMYTVNAQSPGFKAQTINGIEVSTSETVVINFRLEIGSASQTVEVASDSASLQTETPAIGVMVESQSMAISKPAAFELTTDNGEVWISTDGHHWKRK